MSTRSLRGRDLVWACVAFLAASPLAAAESVALRGYNAAIGESSISGISSGAFMAVQFATAWSSVIAGVGVVAGGPFWCAQADADDVFNGYTRPILTATGPCMKGPPPDIAGLLAKVDAKAAAGDIDPVRHLSRQKVYLFHGYNDAVVAKSVTDAAAAFYRHYLGNANRGNLFYQTSLGAGHSLVVLRNPQAQGLNGCSDNDPPYIDQCGYDQAGIVLQHIYGALSPPNHGPLTGTMTRFDQSLYTKPHIPGALSLGDTGYVFVPKACEEGAACRVHIALHGCKQNDGNIGRRFIENTGYNAWADANRLIILYPQTEASPFLPFNPEACWDWWSYVDHRDSYVTKSGAQITTIKAMLDALTARATTAPAMSPAAASQALTVIDTSDTAAALVWTAQDGATVYRVQRAGADGPFTVVGDVAGLSFGDAGLAPETTYRWRVTAIVGGVQGPAIETAAITRATPARCNKPGSCPIGR